MAIDLRISGAFFCALKICSITIETPNAITKGRNQKSKKLDIKNKNCVIFLVKNQLKDKSILQIKL